MGRFVRFLVINLVGIGLVAWGQANLFDWDAVRTSFSSATGGGGGLRTGGYRTHK